MLIAKELEGSRVTGRPAPYGTGHTEQSHERCGVGRLIQPGTQHALRNRAHLATGARAGLVHPPFRALGSQNYA